jgi:hypothetical protein
MKPIVRALVFAWAASFAIPAMAAEPYQAADFAALLQELPKAKISLADGVRQLSKGPETAISGKFELKGGKLMLSVYTVEKGLNVDAERNVLKEYLGSPEAAAWSPTVKVFEDVPHVARSAMQLTLVAMSGASFMDFIQKGGNDQKGTVFSVKPKSEDRKQYVEVLVADGGKVTVLRYDVLTGKLMDKTML